MKTVTARLDLLLISTRNTDELLENINKNDTE